MWRYPTSFSAALYTTGRSIKVDCTKIGHEGIGWNIIWDDDSNNIYLYVCI